MARISRTSRRKPGFEGLESRDLLSTLVVTTTVDAGPGSLREALTQADADASSDPVLIGFAIPGAGIQTIRPDSPLPTITRAVVLDGSTQPGYAGSPRIELDGSAAGPGSGLTLFPGSSGSVIKALAIVRFANDGIDLSFGTGALVVGNYIGIDPTGAVAGNGGDGILASDASATIGGTASGAGNVISGNAGDGIHSASYTSKFFLRGNTLLIQGNAIGTNAGHTLALGNGGDGIFAQGSFDTIGGTTAGAGNVIAANHGAGIATDFVKLPDPFQTVVGAGLLIQGNAIGTDPSGTLHLGNAGSGIDLGEHDSSTIGGAVAGAGNVFGFDKAPELAYLRGTVSGNVFAPGTMFATPSIAVSGSNAGTPIGGLIPLAFTITNNGPGVATHVRVQFTGTDMPFTVEPGPSTVDPSLADTFVLASITPGGSSVIRLGVPAVNPDDTTHDRILGTVLSLDQVTPEIRPGAFSASAEIAATDLPVLAISAVLDPLQPTVNQLETLTYTVINSGDAPATNVQVKIAGLAVPVLASHSSQGTAPSPKDFAGGSPVANLGTIAPGGSATVTVKFLPGATGSVNSVATVFDDQYYDVYYNQRPLVAANFSIEPAIIPPSPDLSVSGIVQTGAGQVGQGVSFGFLVANHGAGPAIDVILALAVPSGVSFVEYSTSQGRIESVQQIPGVVLIDLGPLAPGGSASVALYALPIVGGPLVFTGAASSAGQADPTPVDNLAFAAASVLPAPTVVAIQVLSAKSDVTGIRIRFNASANLVAARDIRNYHLSTIRIPKNRVLIEPLSIKSARYDLASRSVTLLLAGLPVRVGVPISLVIGGEVTNGEPFRTTVNLFPTDRL